MSIVDWAAFLMIGLVGGFWDTKVAWILLAGWSLLKVVHVI